ncbi:MAG TPA: Ig-like domain-containing protein, partial [Gemmatimonadales bacterium]|nr:Ig-like domain-containing protein [Gemmatimonadales bacterium]
QPAGGVSGAGGVATGTLSSTVAESKTVSATIGGVGITQTATVVVNPGAPNNLNFVVQPTSAISGASIAPAIQVEVRDALNNRVTTAANQVSLAFANNAGGGTLTGGAATTPVSGVATFSGVSIDKAGTGYTLSATATGVTGITSSAFNITAGAVSASQSTVSASSPITASSGSSQSTITVTAKDANGNVISGATVVLGASGSNNTLSASGATNSSGVYSGTLSSTTAESKTVSATINGVAITQTAAVTVNAGAATQLVFTSQPTNAVQGSAFNPVVVVTAEDAFGNTDLNFTGSVQMTIATDPGVASSLNGTNPVTAVAGVATFNGLNITTLSGGNGYKLGASSGALTATSAAFNITLL